MAKVVKASKGKTTRQPSRGKTTGNTMKSITDTSSKGVGKYAKKSNAALSKNQAYRLEKKALRNERFGLETKPEIIRAAGQALAMNVAPGTTSYGLAAGSTRGDKTSNHIKGLISGGASQATTSNEEEETDMLPGGATIT